MCLAGRWARPLALPMAQPLGGMPGQYAWRAGRPRRRVGRRLGGRERIFGGLPGPAAAVEVCVGMRVYERFGGAPRWVRPGQVVGSGGPGTPVIVNSTCLYAFIAEFVCFVVFPRFGVNKWFTVHYDGRNEQTVQV